MIASRGAMVVIGMAAAAAASVFVRAQAELASVGETVTGRPLVCLTGAHSKVERPAYERTMNREEWVKLWMRHTGLDEEIKLRYQSPAPEVDFERCMVLAVFRGRTSNSSGVTCDSYVEDADRLLLRFVDQSYQTFGGANEATPFGFFVVPRSGKPVGFEQDVRGLKDEPPRWAEKARLDAVAADAHR